MGDPSWRVRLCVLILIFFVLERNMSEFSASICDLQPFVCTGFAVHDHCILVAGCQELLVDR